MLFSKASDKRITEKIVKVPLSVQDTIPIYRISESGIFELEKRKGPHLFDKMYLFTDINYMQQDENEKDNTLKQFEQLLRSFNVSYKILVCNHYTSDEELKKSILHKASEKKMEVLATEYTSLIEKRLYDGNNHLKQSKYFIITCVKENFKEAKTFFDNTESNVKKAFKRMGSGIIPLDATERLRALHSFYQLGKEKKFNFDWNEYLHLRRDWRNDIINTSIRERSDHLEMEEGKCACTLFVKKYPKSLSDTFMKELLLLEFPIIYCMDTQPLDYNYAYRRVKDKYMMNERSIQKEQALKVKNNDFASDISYERTRQQANIKELMDRMSEFDERLLYVGILITTQAKSTEELKARVEKIKQLGDDYSLDIEVHANCQLDALNTCLPTGSRFVANMRSITSNELSIFVPYYVQEISDNEGYCYGYNINSKNLIIANRKLLKNSNGMVFGDSGSGKSFQVKFEMGQVLAFSKDEIIVIDPMGEYKDICNRWYGSYINMAKSSENEQFINPFHIPPIIVDKEEFVASKSDFAFAICSQAIDPSPLTNRHVNVIDKVIHGLYEKAFANKNRSFTLVDVYNELKEMGSENEYAKELAEQLEVFTNGTLNIFAHQQSNIENNRFTVFGLADMTKRSKKLAMLVMIESITSRIKYNQKKGVTTWVYVDEIHEIWQDEHGLKSLETMWREVRKQGGICTGMSQNVIDANENRSTRTMLSNSAYTLLLNQGKMDVDDVIDIFQLTEEEGRKITEAERGTGLIRLGERIAFFDNTIEKEDPLYKQFNTDFHELVAQKQGDLNEY